MILRLHDLSGSTTIDSTRSELEILPVQPQCGWADPVDLGKEPTVVVLLQMARWIGQLSEAWAKLRFSLTLVLVAIGFYNVAARYVGRFIGQNLSSNGFIETQWYIFSVIFFLMFAYNLAPRRPMSGLIFCMLAGAGGGAPGPICSAPWLALIPFCILGSG
jgi:hypothetical protein